MNKNILLLFFLFTLKLFAQQEARYSQYTYSESSINPAYVGVSERLDIILLHRSQWIGINGAPKSSFLSIDAPLKRNLSLGARINRDEIGASNRTSFNLSFSYKLKLKDDDLLLSLGVNSGLENLNVNINKLNILNTNDVLLHNINSRVNPVFGVGAYIYNDKWYIGLSSPNILSTKFSDKNSVSSIQSVPHLYLTGGRNFRLNENIELKPSFLVNRVKGVPLYISLSTAIRYKEKISFGISYARSSNVATLIGIKLTNVLSLGYAYEHNLNEIGSYNNPTHELTLRFSFSKKDRKKRYNGTY